MLSNFGTIATYQKLGAATLLIKYLFSLADTEGCLCYVDIAEDTPGTNLLKKRGFEQVDKFQIELLIPFSQVEGPSGKEKKEYTHVAMVREPKGNPGPNAVAGTKFVEPRGLLEA